MKIAFIGQKGIPASGGGVEKHVEDLAYSLAKRGHELIVYTRPNYTDKNLKEYKGAKLVSLPTLPTKHLDAISHTLLAVLDVVFRRKVDIIHFHSIGPSSLIWLVKLLKPKTPIIATFHSQCYYNDKWNGIAKSYLKFGERMACKYADKLIVVSKGLEKYVKENYPQAKVEYIPNGVLMPEINPAKEISQRWGLEKDNYILSVSRLVKNKGLEYLISAYKDIDTDKKLVIAGAGNFSTELEKLAAGHKNIIFVGNQTGQTLSELFSNASIFVQPSESEGLSIALLEGMSYGLPCLVSDIEANVEVVKNFGWKFESKNVDDLRNKLKAMLNTSPEGLADSARNLKEIVLKEYSWDMIIDNIINDYRNALNKSKQTKLLIDEKAALS